MLTKLRSSMRSFYFPTWYIPVGLLVLTLLTYGLRALGLGFFWDDWPYLWFFHRFGPSGILKAFAGDRPFLSFIYISSLTAFGTSTQAWQIFGLVSRWLCSLGLWWSFSLAWPRHKNKAAWAVFLFTVYPGFTQQWISVIYGQAFFLFASLFFSIGISLWLARHRQTLARGWIAVGTLLALALSAFTMFSTEYFFGLEMLRPALLWLVLTDIDDCPEAAQAGRWRRLRQTAVRTAAWWGPYLALMGVFVFWRAFIHPFAGYALSTLKDVEKTPLNALFILSLTIIQDFISSSLVAWSQPMQALANLFGKDPANGLRLLAIIGVTGVLCFVYLLRLRSGASRSANLHVEDNLTERPDHWGVQAALVGLYAFLMSGWPTWITGLPVRMGFPLDRYSLAMSVGTSLLLAGLIDILGGRVRTQRDLPRKVIVVSMLVAIAAGFHYTVAASYRQDWNIARDFFWQLSWRAPSVQANTLFASDSMAFKYFEDDSLSAPLNWTLDPNGRDAQMKYILYDILTRHETFYNPQPGQPVQHNFRAVDFTGNTNQVLVFSYAPPGCVRILDPFYDADLYLLPERIQQALPLSNPKKLIQESSQPVAPPTEIFGSEPKHHWCYFFEKADLARQKGDWKAVVQLANESIKLGYRPADPSEYLPFIEAYVNADLYEDAIQLTQSAYQGSITLRPALCTLWKRVYQSPADPYGKYKSALNATLSCPIP